MLPDHCRPPFWIHQYVVQLKDQEGITRIVVDMDDFRGLDAANLEYFTLTANGMFNMLGFMLSDGHCQMRPWYEYWNQVDGKFVKTYAGNCSSPCGGGIRYDEYSCRGYSVSGHLCKMDSIPGRTGDYRSDIAKIRETCNMDECGLVALKRQYGSLIRDGVQVTLTKGLGDSVELDCTDVIDLQRMKYESQYPVRLQYAWMKNNTALDKPKKFKLYL